MATKPMRDKSTPRWSATAPPVRSVRYLLLMLPHHGGWQVHSARALPADTTWVIVGRSPACDISLRDVRVSWNHCKIQKTEDHLLVLDLGSRNGTYVNGNPIAPHGILLANGFVSVGKSILVPADDHRRPFLAVSTKRGFGPLAFRFWNEGVVRFAKRYGIHRNTASAWARHEETSHDSSR